MKNKTNSLILYIFILYIAASILLINKSYQDKEKCKQVSTQSKLIHLKNQNKNEKVHHILQQNY